MEIRAIETLPQALQRYVALFAACFPGASHFSPEYLQWLYRENPDGEPIGYDAFEDDRIAAHYVCIPCRVVIEGGQRQALLSLNTATHPQFQGRGLFTRLASATYEEGARRGYDSVYGVANANSTPGFTRKLGFALVRPLEARIGIGSLPSSTVSRAGARDLSFVRQWDAPRLAWRARNPSNMVRIATGRGRLTFSAPTHRWGIRAWAELPGEAYPEIVARGRQPPSLRLVLGLVPAGARFGSFVPIPPALRPSPLNLIYRPLAGTTPALDADGIQLSFLDFDAF